MKTMFVAALLVSFQSAFAQTMKCDVSESAAGNEIEYSVNVNLTGQTHGDIQRIDLKSLPQISVMLASLNTIGIIHITDNAKKVYSTTKGSLSNGGFVYGQYIMATDVAPRYMNSVSVSCAMVE